MQAAEHTCAVERSDARWPNAEASRKEGSEKIEHSECGKARESKSRKSFEDAGEETPRFQNAGEISSEESCGIFASRCPRQADFQSRDDLRQGCEPRARLLSRLARL